MQSPPRRLEASEISLVSRLRGAAAAPLMGRRSLGTRKSGAHMLDEGLANVGTAVLAYGGMLRFITLRAGFRLGSSGLLTRPISML